MAPNLMIAMVNKTRAQIKVIHKQMNANQEIMETKVETKPKVNRIRFLLDLI